MREDLEYLQQEVKETQEEPVKHTSWVEQIAYGIKPLQSREETPRERMIRLRLVPTEADLRRARRGTSLGSPGVKEYWDGLLAWSKKHWAYLVAGGSLYTILLVACAKRRPK